jgi:hypothetical protein
MRYTSPTRRVAVLGVRFVLPKLHAKWLQLGAGLLRIFLPPFFCLFGLPRIPPGPAIRPNSSKFE